MRRRKREREYNLIQTDANSNNGRVKIRYTFHLPLIQEDQVDQQALHYQVHPKQKIINIVCKYKYSNTCKAANYLVHFKYCTYDCSSITRWTSRTMITTCTLKNSLCA